MAKRKQNSSVETQQLDIVDEAGVTRMSLTTLPGSGEPVIRLYDQQSCERIVIGMSNGRSHVSLLQADGKTTAGFGTNEDGDSAINIYDNRGQVVFMAGTPNEGERQIALYDADGKRIWYAG